jgi:hypothetical protein
MSIRVTLGLRKLVLWSLGLVLGLVVLLAAALVLAARLIDTPKVHAEITHKLSRLVNGQVAWEELHVRLLPLPHGELRGVRVAIPNLLTLAVATTDIKLRLWPLLHGSAEVQAITLQHPDVEVWISRSASEVQPAGKPPTPRNLLAVYRSAMRPVRDTLTRFAPNTTIAVEDGRVNLHLFALPALETRQLQLRLITDERGVTVDASATGAYWERVILNGRVEFADLRALVSLQGSGLHVQKALQRILPDARDSLGVADVGARLEARTDGQTDISVALGLNSPKVTMQRGGKPLDIAPVRLAGSLKLVEEDATLVLDEVQLGELVRAARVTLALAGAKHAPRLDIAVGEIDLAQLRDATLTLTGDQAIIQAYAGRIRGGRLRDLHFSGQAANFAALFALARLRGSARLADGSMRVPALEREATQITANAELLNGVITLSDVSARLGASQFRQASADIVLLRPMRLERARGHATLVFNDLLPGLRARKPFAKLLRSVPTITGTAKVDVRDLALRFNEPARVVYDLSLGPQHVRIETARLPESVDVNGGAVRVTTGSIKADRVGIQVLDSTATLSGDVTDLKAENPRVTARVADGVARSKLIDWIWLRGALPDRLKPATPLRFTAQRVQWRQRGIDVVASSKITGGPTLSVDLSVRDKAFTLRRATIQDHDSDAKLAFAMHDSLLEVGFAGVLAARSVAPIFGRVAENYPGSINGDIQVNLDFGRQGRNTARGELAGARINLRNLIGAPVQLESLDLRGDGDALQIRDLNVDWAGQKATIRGVFAREADELRARLEVDSPGIVIDALRGSPLPQVASAPSGEPSKAGKPFSPWSLPVKGTVALRTDFVEYGGYRVQGVRAVGTLERDSAALDVTEASLCGITGPLSLRMSPTEFDATANVTAKDQSLDALVQCLGGQELVISGRFNMTSALHARGPAEHFGKSLAEHLAGSVEFSARDGEIRKMTLLGKILSLKSVSGLTRGDVGLGGRGFKYRSIVVGAGIEKGKITVHEAALDSAALGLAATGTINVENFDSRLTVLVAPFSTVDRVARRIPIFGYVIGGAFTSVPVGVAGDIRKPSVVPLGPGAVGSEVLGVFQRTFRLPGRMGASLGAQPGP